MKRKVAMLASLICAVGLVSCRTPSSGIVVESYPKTKVTINSKMVGKCVQVTQYTAAKRNGLLQAQVTVENTTKRDIAFEYMYRWMDKDGMQVVSGMSTWVPVSISSRQKVLLNAIAPNKEVEDFILDVRFDRPSVRW